MKDIEDALMQSLTFSSEKWDFIIKKPGEAHANSESKTMWCLNREIDVSVSFKVRSTSAELALDSAVASGVLLSTEFAQKFSRLALVHYKYREKHLDGIDRAAKATELRRRLSILPPVTQ